MTNNEYILNLLNIKDKNTFIIQKLIQLIKIVIFLIILTLLIIVL